MPKGIPARGYRISRKTGLPLGNKAFSVAANVAVTTHQQKYEPPVVTETEAEIRAKLDTRFSALDIMAHGTIHGRNRSLIVSGPAGLGKSYNVEQIAKKAETTGDINVTTVSGYVRPTGLYKTLYENRFNNCVIIFDDADSIFSDETSLNLLKKACDSTEERNIFWGAETKMETEDGERLPRKFSFEGSVIFITNYDFDDMIARGSRLAPHFEALVSRSHYLDLAMKTKRDYMVRIKQVVGNGMLQDKVTLEQEQELVSFIEDNMDSLRELSLRMVVKLSDLMKVHPMNWKSLAKITCMR